jgi:hypothetical protein
MHLTPRKLRARAGTLLLALVPVACAENGTPVDPGPEAAAPTTGLTTRLVCHGTRHPLAVTCAEPSAGGDARANIIGGQHVYTRLTSSNVAFIGDTMQFDVTLKNLIPQPMGTANGFTPSLTGVRIFFQQPLRTTVGSGASTVLNADGADAFMGAGQLYYQYSGSHLGSDGILSTNETSSPRTWRFHFDPGVEEYAFALLIAADVPFPHGWVEITPVDPRVLVGGTRALSKQVRNSVNEQRFDAVTWHTNHPAVATVSAAGVVTGVSAGNANITAITTDGQRVGAVTVTVCPDLGLAVGGVATLAMPASSTVCLGGGASGAEYTVVPVNTAGLNAALSVTAAGIVPVTGAPTPVLLPRGGGTTARASRVSTPRGADAFESRLRRREAAELAPLMKARRTRTPGARRAITPGAPVVGAQMTLNVQSTGTCASPPMTRTGRVKVLGTRVIVMADDANPSTGLTTADYQEIADRFDALVWPALTGSFGAPADVDGNGRVIVFFTTAVNALTPAGLAPATHGFTLRRDLFSTSMCAASNAGEMIYMAAADPAGTVNGNARTVASVKDAAAPTLAHELAHLVNASRRYEINYAPDFEAAWLDEGLAAVAEELVFYAASGKQPRQNLGYADAAGGTAQAAFAAYAAPNLARLRDWLQAPHARGLFQAGDHPATRGAAWAFLRYAADRKGGVETTFWSALVNATDTGMVNLQAAIGTAPGAWARDFSAAMYADDALSGAAAVHTQPSWNFRSVYGGLDYNGDSLPDGYPLSPRNPVSAVADVFTLAGGGGAAYLRMGVAAGDVASVTLQANGVAPPSTLMVSVVRRK